ncbi:iron complex transport system substrate-binding protein [Marinospirillum celere]|uniref:Iron complex transport system substrate-binding protein n=1 Tax=Marinospirillum celere TaxID=1122252 RepID=A0A1I1EWG9_9GAMM|nr:cobalamin-binding protein [Marinospirillum celere]SFB89838.1 iron complex transport system substrate-binding protein [Marinospirillum celere]
MPFTWLHWLLLMILVMFSQAQAAALEVTDAAGRSIQLEKPAERIISLAPHLTENLFAVGAGDQLVGAVSYSDYPEAALQVPRVGNYNQLDLEAIIALQPDLILAWHSGNPRNQVERLERLGLRVFYSEARSFEEITQELQQLGQLTGHQSQAEEVTRTFDEGISTLTRQYADKQPVEVFYQIWEQPLMTINGKHMISQMLALCGGKNIYASSSSLTPRIDRESLLAANPEVIMGGSDPSQQQPPEWLMKWTAFSQLQAVQLGNLFTVDSSLVTRPTLRSLEGTQAICEHLDSARQQLTESAQDG